MNESGLCVRCRAQRPVYDVLRSWGVFDSPLKEALHRMKYRRDLGLGEALARGMIQFLDTLEWSCDQVVPVPLAKRRLKERGYNQVALVAIPLALRFGLVYRPQALERIRETASQVGLSAAQRRENVRGAFQADSSVRGKSILLVDDVSTTGATLSSAAGALFAAGAGSVKAVTVARALPDHDLSFV